MNLNVCKRTHDTGPISSRYRATSFLMLQTRHCSRIPYIQIRRKIIRYEYVCRMFYHTSTQKHIKTRNFRHTVRDTLFCRIIGSTKGINFSSYCLGVTCSKEWRARGLEKSGVNSDLVLLNDFKKVSFVEVGVNTEQ